MNGLVLLAQAGGGGPVAELARTFGVDWAHLIAQIISFGLVCFLLHRYAYRPVLAMPAAPLSGDTPMTTPEAPLNATTLPAMIGTDAELEQVEDTEEL